MNILKREDNKMQTFDLKKQMNFEKSIKIGDKVRIHWTNNYSVYAAEAIVSKINQNSVRAKITDAILRGDKIIYPANHEIISPLCNLSTIDRWSHNNCIKPIENQS